MKPANKKNFIYGLVPAKLNSKSIHQKNLQKIKKKSLIEITIDQIKKTKKIDKIFVSSESEKIKKICEIKKVTFFKRNKIFSTTKASANSVILEFIKKNNLKKDDTIVYLQPTSPFRNYKHINACLKKFEKNKQKTLVSIKKVNFSIFKCISLKSNRINPIFSEKFLSTNRQNFPQIYAPNGAIYIFLVKNFMKKKSIPQKNSIPFLMNEKDSLDIDSVSDLKRARNPWRILQIIIWISTVWIKNWTKLLSHNKIKNLLKVHSKIFLMTLIQKKLTSIDLWKQDSLLKNLIHDFRKKCIYESKIFKKERFNKV